MPRPPPAVKLKRLKLDCAEADAMSPPKASKNSIRFLNLDLLFRRAALVNHDSATTAVFHLDARTGNENQPFSQAVNCVRRPPGTRGESSHKTPASTRGACFHPLGSPSPDQSAGTYLRQCGSGPANRRSPIPR